MDVVVFCFCFCFPWTRKNYYSCVDSHGILLGAKSYTGTSQRTGVCDKLFLEDGKINLLEYNIDGG